MKTDIIERYSSLSIYKCGILSLVVRPGAKIVIEIVRAAVSEDVGYICELQFNRVRHSVLRAQGSPGLGEITEHYAHFKPSDIIERLKTEQPRLYDPKGLIHFGLNFTGGSFDIIAADFQFSVILEISRGQSPKLI